MGLFRAAIDALGGTLADQWKDFYTVPDGLRSTSAFFPAVLRGTNRGRGSNLSGSEDVISNGSKILVPEGYGLILMQDGAVTGFAAEPGAYEWHSEEQDSQSIFAGNGIVSPLITTSWERFKFGGRPKSQQRAFYVTLKELPNNKFGTPSEIYWDDSYLNAQVGAMTRGSYTVRILDPILFVKNWLPAKYLNAGTVFDFTDLGNDASDQLFNEVVSSLAPALSRYVNGEKQRNRITQIQQDSVGFALSLSQEVETAYRWKSERGLEIVSTAILSIEYDQMSRQLLSTVQRADALLGTRGNSNLQASVAAGLETAGETGGASGILGLGIAAGSVGLAALQQPDEMSRRDSSGGPPSPDTDPTASAREEAGEDPMMKLARFKQMLDADLITQADYDAAKAKVLGL